LKRRDITDPVRKANAQTGQEHSGCSKHWRPVNEHEVSQEASDWCMTGLVLLVFQHFIFRGRKFKQVQSKVTKALIAFRHLSYQNGEINTRENNESKQESKVVYGPTRFVRW
jgi:hypothetical protein